MSTPWPSAIYLVGTILVLVLIVLYCRDSALRHIPGLPGAGYSSLRHVRSIISKGLLKDYVTWCRQYGELVRIEPNVLLTSSPDLVMHMSGVRSRYGKDSAFYLLAHLAPGKENLASLLDDPTHNRHKSLLAPAYTKDISGAREPTIDAHLRKFLHDVQSNYLSTTAAVKLMDLSKGSQYFTTKAIIELTYGPDFEDLLEDKAVAGLVEMPEGAFNMPGFLYATRLTKVMGLIGQLMASKEDTDDGFGKFLNVASRLKNSSAETKRLGMVQTYLQNGMSPEQVAHDALTQVLAGQVTVSAAISGIMILLMSNPRVLSALRKEIDAAVSDGAMSLDEVIISYAKALALPYLQAVVREGLRFFPPTVDPLPRVAPQEGDSVKVGDRTVFIPGGTRVLTSTWSITRNTEVFGEDADAFRPERWIGLDGPRSARMQKVADLIFGFGKGRCLGITIARMMICKSIFELVRRFDMALTEPWSPMSNVLNMGAWERSGMMVVVTEREDN
ncbi:hypothetical protein N7476_006163 [Penicillium atrosanguineum]|uniref:Cytochrome P450 n=1 Tax=Penicillium atrosanguineum TaxID=1132637 RepID=A0A9W9PWL3_9EURO|nr:hypothetical protein N7476_006163 [Penicillium atrosanguineum]